MHGQIIHKISLFLPINQFDDYLFVSADWATFMKTNHTTYRKVASTRLSQLVALLRNIQKAYEGEIWSLYTVTLGQKVTNHTTYRKLRYVVWLVFIKVEQSPRGNCQIDWGARIATFFEVFIIRPCVYCINQIFKKKFRVDKQSVKPGMEIAT
jgi:hypothetical protein